MDWRKMAVQGDGGVLGGIVPEGRLKRFSTKPEPNNAAPPPPPVVKKTRKRKKWGALHNGPTRQLRVRIKRPEPPNASTQKFKGTESSSTMPGIHWGASELQRRLEAALAIQAAALNLVESFRVHRSDGLDEIVIPDHIADATPLSIRPAFVNGFGVPAAGYTDQGVYGNTFPANGIVASVVMGEDFQRRTRKPGIFSWAFTDAEPDIPEPSPNIYTSLMDRERGGNAGRLAFRPRDVGNRGRRWTAHVEGWNTLGRQETGPVAYLERNIIPTAVQGSRRDNVVHADDLLVHACGDAVHFLQISTQEQTFLRSKAGRGIGAVAVHPQRNCFAVCEKGHNPDIIIYSYPELEEKRVMTNGTERVFSAASFNIDGTRLATVGGHPDYWLTVWDWDHQTMILRSKAFSQEVFRVNFSQYFPGQLITSGVGHIRFWKMASTFTGLKLEGAIAKFGTVSISDVAGFVELRNSKAGYVRTETGTILVWDDGLIKAQLKRKGQFMCHDSMIEFITLDEDAKQMTTAGADGYIKFWNLDVEFLTLWVPM